MENITELFIIFPKYEDDDNINNTYCYLDSYKLKTEEEVDSYLNRLNLLLSFIENENYVGYYDLVNIKSFTKPLVVLGEEFYPKSEQYLRSLLKEWEELEVCVCQLEKNAFVLNGLAISNDILCEIAKRVGANKNNSHLLINHEAYACMQDINLLYNGIGVPLSQCSVSICEVAQWFELNRRPKRVFNLNPKHGENGKGEHRGASPLLCCRDKAEQMLHKAIGIDFKSLYYFDTEHDKHIEFMHENTRNNSYHGFHVDSDRISKGVELKLKSLK